MCQSIRSNLGVPPERFGQWVQDGNNSHEGLQSGGDQTPTQMDQPSTSHVPTAMEAQMLAGNRNNSASEETGQTSNRSNMSVAHRCILAKLRKRQELPKLQADSREREAKNRARRDCEEAEARVRRECEAEARAEQEAIIHLQHQAEMAEIAEFELNSARTSQQFSFTVLRPTEPRALGLRVPSRNVQWSV